MNSTNKASQFYLLPKTPGYSLNDVYSSPVNVRFAREFSVKCQTKEF